MLSEFARPSNGSDKVIGQKDIFIVKSVQLVLFLSFYLLNGYQLAL